MLQHGGKYVKEEALSSGTLRKNKLVTYRNIVNPLTNPSNFFVNIYVVLSIAIWYNFDNSISWKEYLLNLFI